MRISRKQTTPSTSQRRLLLRLLREESGHLTARELYSRATEHDAEVSLATVYRTLRLFKEEGLIDEMRFGGCTCRYYEATRPGNHYHMLCRQCGRVLEFDTPAVGELMAEVERSCGFKVTGVEICLEGYCPDCAQKEAGKSDQ
ncbi:MAG: transcriptional repressor [Dehalococcoidia bacterium]|nr:transcriptional repressor [Dehalococcoidia bacterium]